jgi:ATP-binding cassette subfamily C protein
MSTAAGYSSEGDDPIRDLGHVRAFILQDGLAASLDLPWTLVFVGALGCLHPLLSVVPVVFAIVTAGLTVSASRLSQPFAAINAKAISYAAVLSREDGILRALGLMPELVVRWLNARREGRSASRVPQRLLDLLRSIIPTLQMLHGIVLLVLAAYLSRQHAVGLGAIIVASMLARRIVPPVDIFVRSLEQMLPAVAAWRRLNKYARLPAPPIPQTAALEPNGQLVLTGLSGGPPNSLGWRLPPVSVRVAAGEVLGVTGPSGSGKTVLANLLAGCWPVKMGTMTISGTDGRTLCGEEIAKLIGYMPQDDHFVEGSIADNIARLSVSRDRQQLLAVARLVGLEDLTGVDLDMPIEERASRLSAGIRRRIALARAIYGKRPLLVLDDPTAHLDSEGEGRLLNVVEKHKEAGGATILLTGHIPLLKICDRILVLRANEVPRLATPIQLFC